MQESRGREIHFNAGDLLFNFAQHDSMSHKATPETFFNMVVEGTNFAWTFTKKTRLIWHLKIVVVLHR